MTETHRTVTDAEGAATYCRQIGYTPTQLRGMTMMPSGTIMEGDFEKAVWACLRKRR